MMGRVVVDKLLPLQKYAPFKSTSPPHNPEDIVPDILPKPSISTNRKEVLSVANDQGLGLALGSLFGVNFARSNEERVQLESQEVKQYTLDGPDDVFDLLMENDLYAADVQKLLTTTKKRHAYLVTGFLTTSGTLWTRTKGHSRTQEFNVAFPVSQIAGSGLLPSELTDPSFEPSRTMKTEQHTEMHVVDEEIFAVSYNLVKVKYSFNKDAPHFTKKTPAVGPPKRANIRQLALGEDDERIVDVGVEDAANADVFLADVDDEEQDETSSAIEDGFLL
ncbi:hypothetical protein B0A49_00542 [Cryomyces minteri]|nr:hypothetical protein B0A49_00542 [Cryomyces minteri]